MGTIKNCENPKMKITQAVIFAVAAARMKDAFERNGEKCGYYDPNTLPHGGPERKRRDFDDDFDRYNREDPFQGTKQITTGYRKWAERYISSCNGQAQYQHQVKRFNKYYGLMIDALNNGE